MYELHLNHSKLESKAKSNMSAINYSIGITDPLHHYFDITINYQPQSEQFDEIYLPNWIPGSYMIRDFAKHIVELKAFDKNGELQIKPLTKSRFKISHQGQKVEISYKLYAFDLSVRKAYLDQQFGFLNFTSACFTIKGLEQAECLVELTKPEHPLANSWIVATGLKQCHENGEFAWGQYSADNYLALTDYPVLFGDLDIATFEVANVPHHMITVGRHFGSLQRVVKDLKPLCEYHYETFGEFPKEVDRYLFMTMLTDNGFGGLEHLNSTALLASRMDIIGDEDDITDEYQTFLSLCSHEYLHTWNVKQLKPVEFIPYDLDQEVYTTQLWFYEGVTSYLDDLSLVETQTIIPGKYLETLSKVLTRVQRGQGQYRQSVIESSYLTWTKFYQQDHTAPDQIVSYYQKGALIACFADLSIRKQSNHTMTLRDLMKTAWQRFGATGIGTKQEDLESLFHNFMEEAEFQVFKKYLYDTSIIDLTEAFSDFGVELNYCQQTKQNQWFALPKNKDNSSSDSEKEASSYWLGALLSATNNQVIVKQVMENSPAARAGLAVGDQLIALNQIKISNENIEGLLKRITGKSGNLLHYFRKDSLLCAELAIESSPNFVAQLTITSPEKLTKWLPI